MKNINTTHWKTIKIKIPPFPKLTWNKILILTLVIVFFLIGRLIVAEQYLEKTSNSTVTIQAIK